MLPPSTVNITEVGTIVEASNCRPAYRQLLVDSGGWYEDLNIRYVPCRLSDDHQRC